MITLTGGEALLRALKPEAVPFVFGVVGGKLGPFLQAVFRDPDIRYVGARHEGAAAMMACAVFPATGRLGVAAGECGSGGGNLVPGIAIANANNVPLLVVTSNNQHAASYPRRGMFAEMDTESVYRPITKWNTAVHDGRRIPELVRTALREAFTGRPGPVHLDVPQDVLRGTFHYHEHEFVQSPPGYRPTSGPAATAEQVACAADLLATAKRPLMIAGGGVIAAGACYEFRSLVSALNAAATATQMGMGSVPSADAHFIGHATVTGGDALLRACREADAVLAVGCRFSSWLWDDQASVVGHGASVIHVNLDPGNIGNQVSVEVGIVGDAKHVLGQLLAALSSRLPVPPEREWVNGIAEAYRQYKTRLEALASDRGPVMHPAALAHAVAQWLPADALVAFDGGHTTFWSNDFTPVTEPRTRFNEPGMSQLGYGLPCALALKLSYPDRAVLNVTGDGAFGFTLAELDTARRYKLPVINIIHNNAAWGIIQFGYRRAGADVGCDLGETNYAEIARGFGAYGEVVTRPEDVRAALGRALDSGLPAVLDCRVRFEPHPGLGEFARMGNARA